MTDSYKSDNRRSETDHQALRQVADRIARGEEVGLSADDELKILRLNYELEQTRHALERTEIELEAKSEQLQGISRELEASKNDFWALAERIPAALIVLDEKGIVERANPRARQMLTGEFRPIIGLAFSSFVAPEDLGTYLRNIKISPTDKKKVFSFELRMRDFAGRSIHTSGQVAALFDPENKLLHWHLAFFDVSEKKRLAEALRVSQEHLALATSGAKIGIWVADLKTGKSHWNEQMYRMLGLEPRDEPEDQDVFFDLIHPADRQGVLQSVQTVAALEGEIDLEFRIIRPDDGQVRWLAAKGSVERDPHGRPFRLQGVNFDITDRKQAEETERLAQLRLAEQLAKTERINRELSQYAYAVSHDLKAPMRAIRNYSDFLYEDLAESLSGERKEYLEGLKTAADQGQKLIDDLLAFSRIGRAYIKAEKIDMPAIINEVKSFLNLSGDVDLAVQKDWPMLETDPLLLVQIMKNLVANAVKFNDNAAKRIEIGWTQPRKDGSIEFYVRDNGLGIDPQYQEQIFGIFQRLHTSREYEGTGIGLAMVQKAAHELGGSVRVESVPGEGSTFFVAIPVKIEER